MNCGSYSPFVAFSALCPLLPPPETVFPFSPLLPLVSVALIPLGFWLFPLNFPLQRMRVATELLCLTAVSQVGAFDLLVVFCSCKQQF